MIKAVLLDLDNTLIHNSDIVFAREFIRLAQPHLGNPLGIPDISAVMRTMIQALAHERHTIINNRTLILNTLSAASGQNTQFTSQTLDEFYWLHYPTLSPFVKPVAAAVPLITELLAQNIIVVIATNPIYLASGIQQRLTWGHLDAHTYALVTDADTMHFAKPDPAYYAEIIARVGVEPDEALMVGDNPVNDWQAAERVGLSVCPIEDDPEHVLRQFHARLLHANWHESFARLPLTPEAIMHALRGNQGALMGLVEQAAPYTWRQHPLAGEWSVLQIVSHLVESERHIQRPRLEQILAAQHELALLVEPPLPPSDLPTLSDDLLTLLALFLEERGRTLTLLYSLASADWSRPARHTVFSYTTLQEMAAFTAQHDRMHIQQLCQTLGKCSDEF